MNPDKIPSYRSMIFARDGAVDMAQGNPWTRSGWTGSNPFSFMEPRITKGVRFLIIATGVCFAAQLVLEMVTGVVGLGDLPSFVLGFNPGLFMRGMVWQPFSYMFLHAGLMHLAFNMLWLYLFGPEVERLLGTRQFYFFYVTCGVLGVLTTLVSLAVFGHNPVVVGASGSIMGLLVAFAMIDPDREFVLFPLPVTLSARGLVFVVIVLNILQGVQGGQNSVETHLGGLAAGYLLMRLIPAYHRWRRSRMLRNVPPPPTQPDASAFHGDTDDLDDILDFRRKPRPPRDEEW
ncbi:MAG TPA: rhomboid family intramembrane serine protease [Candidatus Hydrogenedentes bacterium]|mgnify:FL=1|nr:rhomboid family intramembrane serine protease [Candidatus Hydrogenedentota bacterium]HOK90005.1 rhomboid family intramembrane serine protease [Candidatus Hydrogenedentota bacterium]